MSRELPYALAENIIHTCFVNAITRSMYTAKKRSGHHFDREFVMTEISTILYRLSPR